jgi:hypothetical protein
VSQDRHLAELYRRDPDGSWRYEVIEDGELSFDCGGLAIRFTLADVYEDVMI